MNIILKISGGILRNENNTSLYDLNIINNIVCNIKNVIENGIKLCLVVGGGNICRGRDIDHFKHLIQRTTLDYAGMCATIINAIILRDIIKQSCGFDSKVMSAIECNSICEKYNTNMALDYMKNNILVICAAGIGNPYFSTDTAAVLRAIELRCNLLLKGTNVDGIYDADPHIKSDAIRYNNICYSQILKYGLNIMDATSIALARDNNLEIRVFSIKTGNIFQVTQGLGAFTTIKAN